MKNKKINMFILLIISILVLFFTLKDDFNEIINQIIKLDIRYFVLALILMLISLIFKAKSLHTVIKKVKPKYKMKKAFNLSLESQFFNAITPFATGGQPFQIYSLKKEGINVTKGTNIIIQNFTSYQVALILIGIFFVTYNHYTNLLADTPFLKNLVILGFLINFIVIIVLFVVAFSKKSNKYIINKIIDLLYKFKIVKNKKQKKEDFNEYIETFHKGASILLKDKTMFIKTIIYNLISLISLYLIPLAVIYSLGGKILPLEVLLASSYTMLIGSFVPIPGAAGGLEYGYVMFYGNFIKNPILNASMLIWRFITYYLTLILGTIIFNIKER